MSKNKLKPEQRDQIIELTSQGVPAAEIEKQLNIDAKRIGGVISWATREGRLASSSDRRGPKPPSEPSPFPSHNHQSEASMNQSATPASSAPMLPVSEDPGWRSMPAGSGFGFSHPTQAVEFKLDRIEPRDGVLEVSADEPEDDEIGKRFGAGTYRLWKREGTKLPVARDIIISLAYGESRYPNRRTVEPQRAHGGRFLQGRTTENDDDDRLPQRPSYFRPQMDVRSYQPDSRQMADVARTGMTAQESIAITAVNKLTEINEKNMDRMEKAADRDREPQSTITDFLKEQQIAADRRATEERARRDEERKEERAERDRREHEREAQHKREQEDRDAQHKRDMDRIKAENDARIASEREARNGMIEVEKQRVALMREEAKIREDALRNELERNRAENKEERATFLAQLKETKEETDEQIEDMQASIKVELEKEREGLKREHELKREQLENDRKHNEDMLKLREEILKGQQGEDISKVLTKLVEGVERTVKEVVDLKKIEAVSTEERLAKVGQQGSAGALATAANVTQTSGQSTSKTQEPPVAMQGQKTGNGHAVQQPQAEAASQEQTPEIIVRQLAREPVFINMISKWAKQLQAGNNAGIFSNLFMELMRDDGTPEVLKVRKALGWFVDEMSTKTWAEMYDFLKPAIPQNLHATFEAPYAEVFYDQFKMMVVESVGDYWKMYFAQKQAEIEAAKQAHQEQQSQQQSQQQASPAAPAAPTMKVDAPAEEPKPEVTVDAA